MVSVLEQYQQSSRRRYQRAARAQRRLDIQGLRMVAVLAVFAMSPVGLAAGRLRRRRRVLRDLRFPHHRQPAAHGRNQRARCRSRRSTGTGYAASSPPRPSFSSSPTRHRRWCSCRSGRTRSASMRCSHSSSRRTGGSRIRTPTTSGCRPTRCHRSSTTGRCRSKSSSTSSGPH